MPAPIASIIAQIGIPVLAKSIGSALVNINHPAAKTASNALEALGAALQKGQISPEQLVEANRHTEKMADILIQEKAITLSEINKSLRQEVLSEDKYVRRMRPTFGYLMAITWTAQMLAVAYIIIFETSKAHIILQAMESLGTIWAVALSVLGIYVYKRSHEKQLYLMGNKKEADIILPASLNKKSINFND